MGLFPSWSTTSGSPAAPKASTDGAFEAPNRSARSVCWEARDNFFACLDKNNIVDSIRDKDGAEKACSKEDQILHQDCATSWVTYFKQRRVMEHKKKIMLEGLQQEGAQQLPQGMGGPPRPGDPQR